MMFASSTPFIDWFQCNLWMRMKSVAKGVVGSLLFASVISGAAPRPATAAERVVLSYGFIEISASVDALRTYAETGIANDELRPYLNFLGVQQREQVRTALQAKQDISPVELSQFLYSSIGTNILRYMGTIVQTQGRRDGLKGLRGALVLAAAEPEGLSLLGVIEKFPTDAVRIDTVRAFRSYESFTGLIRDTEDAIAAIKTRSATATDVPGTVGIGSLSEPGPYAVETSSLQVVDRTRQRTLPTDVYLPSEKLDAPLIIISHGLGGDRKGFVQLSQHLASHGYVVAALDHPGSNTNQLLSLFKGTTGEIAEPTEFTDRPADVSFLIDELLRIDSAGGRFTNERSLLDTLQSGSDSATLPRRIDPDKIGIIGHSFGGYTALALAGAQLNYDNLRTNCESDDFIFNAANPSMLLQCTALAAPDQFALDVRDERIKAVITFNPVTSSIFGSEGFSQVQIPSLVVAGSEDPIAPALLEQIQPFIWLDQNPESPDHFLALIEGGSHVYELPSLVGPDVALANELVSPDVPLGYSYLDALSLGFFEAELEQDTRYKAVLENANILQLGQPSLPLFVVNGLAREILTPEAEDPTVTDPTATDPTVTDPTETVPASATESEASEWGPDE